MITANPDTPITTPAGQPVITQLGIVRTVAEAATAFVETVARDMVCADHGRRRCEDAADKVLLGDALSRVLGVTIVDLYTTYGARINDAYSEFTRQTQPEGQPR